MRKQAVRCWAGMVSLVFAGVSLAEESFTSSLYDFTHISWGAGVFASGEVYLNQGSDAIILPYATSTPRYYDRTKRVFLRDGYLGFRPMRKPYNRFDFAIVGTITGFSLDRQTAGPLAGISERKITGELGLLGALVLTDQVRFDVTATHDVFSVHESYRVRGVLSYTKREGDWELIPNIGFIHRPSKFNNYYFGVSAAEASAGVPQYTAGSSTSPFLSLIYSRNLGERWGMDINVNYEFFPSEVKNSPIVDADSWPGVFLGFSYRFGD